MTSVVTAVSRDGAHRFSKQPAAATRLIAGLGLAGDAHAEETVQHLCKAGVMAIVIATGEVRAGDAIAAAVERLTEWYEGLIYRHCTMTIILNPGVRDRLERMGVARVCCLPCGVDVTTFSPARRDEAWRERLGIAPASTVLLYAGRLSAEKELDVLFDAYDRLPPGKFSLVIAGDGPDASATARYASARAGVTYVGHVESRAELATVYASSDIFLSPGRHETFGMATLEAISCGLSVVGIANSGTATIVPPEIGVLAPAGDPGAFAQAISTVATWPLADRRRVCHDFARERYAWDLVLDQYFKVYRQVIDDAAKAPAHA